MPCYLFTYRGHGTWLPDHPQGYVRRKEGLLESDAAMATCYRRNLIEDPVTFSPSMQRQLIAEAIRAFQHQELRGHFIATETTHLHILVSWRNNATWRLVRRRLASSLTRRLNNEVERRTWFAKQPSRKKVRERQHFEYLMNAYLPKHSGLKWCEDRGVFS